MNSPAASTPDPVSLLTHSELRQLLELAIAQIDIATREAAASADALSQALGEFTKSADGSDAAQTALTHLQFFDKLTQRLAHVREGLDISARELQRAPAQASQSWPRVIQKIRERYTTAEERVLFDFHFNGLGRQVMADALGQLRAASRTGELDLF